MAVGKSIEDKNLARIAQQKKRETAVRKGNGTGQGPGGRVPLNNCDPETKDPDLRIRSKLEAIKEEGVAGNLMSEHPIKAVDQEMGSAVKEKKNIMARAFVFQTLPEDILLPVAKHKDAKDLWEVLCMLYLGDRKSVVSGKRVALGGRRLI